LLSVLTVSPRVPAFADPFVEGLARGAPAKPSSGMFFMPLNVVTRRRRSNTSGAVECARLQGVRRRDTRSILSEVAVMVLGKLLSPRSGAQKRPEREIYRVVPLVLMVTLAACNPVETWRDWTGASRN